MNAAGPPIQGPHTDNPCWPNYPTLYPSYACWLLSNRLIRADMLKVISLKCTTCMHLNKRVGGHHTNREGLVTHIVNTLVITRISRAIDIIDDFLYPY